jgi:hypothetical protein
MQDKENRSFASSLHLSGRTIHEILESSMGRPYTTNPKKEYCVSNIYFRKLFNVAVSAVYDAMTPQQPYLEAENMCEILQLSMYNRQCYRLSPLRQVFSDCLSCSVLSRPSILRDAPSFCVLIFPIRLSNRRIATFVRWASLAISMRVQT